MLNKVMALMLVGIAQQEAPATNRGATQLPEVVVEGRLPEDVAREFVNEVSGPPSGATVARWNRPVCVGVVNLRPVTAQFLINRISTVAEAVGVAMEGPGCGPDVVVVATTDAERLTRELVNRRRAVLAPGNSIQSRSRGDLEAFAEVERPVRWWHISTAVDPVSGRNVVRRPADDNVNASTASLVENGPSVRGASSLIASSVRQDLRRAVIIIDFDEIGDDIDFDQLADYVAFVALAQVDPEADTSGFSTILNLFDDPTTPGLTEWDRAYLWGLYNSDDTARGDAGREAALRREMLRAREQRAAPAAE